MLRSDYRSEIDKDLKYRYVTLKQTMQTIADHWGCSIGTIHNHIKYMGIKPRYKVELRGSRLNLKMTSEDWAYLAGIFDGEGTICLTRRKRNMDTFNPYTVIGNTSTSLMGWISKHTGLGCCVYVSKRYHNHYKTMYKWEVKRVLEVYEILRGVYPYLVIKKDNAKEVIMYCKEMIDKYNV